MIEVNLEKKSKFIKKKIIKFIVEFILTCEKFSSDKEVLVLVNLVTDDTMTKLNKNYKKREGTTDVLSFNFNEYEDEYFFLGEIYISIDVVKKQAMEFKHSFLKELVILLIHGVLHLLGYEHNNGERKKKIMQSKEKKYLELVKNEIFEGDL